MCLSVEGLHTQNSSERLGGFLGFIHLRKSLSHHYLTTRKMEQRLQWPHMTSYTDFIKLVLKVTEVQTTTNYNKQQWQNYGGSINLISRVAISHYSKYPVFNNRRHTKKQQTLTHAQEKKIVHQKLSLRNHRH